MTIPKINWFIARNRVALVIIAAILQLAVDIEIRMTKVASAVSALV